MPKKIYAIKEGYDSNKNIKIQNTIVNTWTECLKYVKGVKGAKYKSFTNVHDANDYLNSSSSIKKSDNSYPKDCMHIYVDGSYNSETNRYSYAFVSVYNDKIMHIEGNAFDCNMGSNIRQIAGELKAAASAAEYALKSSQSKVVIFHDYMGISNHATGEWERKEKSSKDYYEKMQDIMGKGLEIIFVKVDSHTGDLYNEMADEICKFYLSIPSDKVVSKYLKSNTLKVSNQRIKEILEKIAPDYAYNIIVEDLEVSFNSDLNMFKKITNEFEDDYNKCVNMINNLSEDKKTEFIVYLLKNKS